MRTEGGGERAWRLGTGRLPTADGVRQPEDSTASTNGYLWGAMEPVESRPPRPPTALPDRHKAPHALSVRGAASLVCQDDGCVRGIERGLP